MCIRDRYFTGIAVGVLAALLLKSTVFKGEAVPFVMELPNYCLLYTSRCV